jgi:hypothetical protein
MSVAAPCETHVSWVFLAALADALASRDLRLEDAAKAG